MTSETRSSTQRQAPNPERTAQAELAQGVLKVHLAKSEAAKPKRIEVRGG